LIRELRITFYVFFFIFSEMSPLSPVALQSIIDRLLAARMQSLVHRPLRSLLASLDAVVARFLDPTSEERQEAEACLPAETGLSPEMIRHVLPLIFQGYRAERLEELLRDELGDPDVLDTFVLVAGGIRKAYGPRLITQVLAGNLPGAGLDSVIFALLVKSATLVKAASSAPLLPTLFARSLTRLDPDLGACLAVVTWPGGQTALEDIAFSRADVVIASGSDESLAAIRPHVLGQFIGYGHKVSFSVIAREMLSKAEDLAHRAAYDAVLFDQRGCLSPQLVYVDEGGRVTPGEFAALLAQALEHWQHLLPRGAVPAAASVAIRRVRDQAEWQALAGKAVALYTSPVGTNWTVIYEADPAFVLSPLYRTVRVKPLSSLTQLDSLLASWQPYLEAVGVAAPSGKLLQIGELLGRVGVSRICPIGTMQIPPLSWRHGGRPRLADLVRWVEREE
jgi:hypothetical protein